MRPGRKVLLSFLALFAGCVILFAFDLILGSVKIPFGQILSVFEGDSANKSWYYILWGFRLPKALTALLTGAGLSVAGLQMQTLFRNPLAGPYVLGISSGASLGVALYVLAGTFFSFGTINILTGMLGSWGLILFAIAGAGLVLVLVFLTSLKVNDPVSLLIIGIMFGSITGAVVNVLQYFSDPLNVQSFLIWTFGSLGGVTWDKLYILVPVVLIGLLIAVGLQKPMNALLLGDNYAQGIGVNVRKIRLWVILSTSLLAGSLTAFTGPIAFIGVAVPHLARSVFKTSDHMILIPGSALIGSCLMLICDIVSQLPGYQNTLPINSVSAIFGAPVVIWVIIRSRNVKASFS
ncbi:MAG: iron ABC transporter permease [Bacteroidota bacterium]|nr:iron ABC transporter permease [Bacteroidota bacterium]